VRGGGCFFGGGFLVFELGGGWWVWWVGGGCLGVVCLCSVFVVFFWVGVVCWWGGVLSASNSGAKGSPHSTHRASRQPKASSKLL